MSKFNIGWSEVSITPDKKVSLAGQFYERISEYVETPITATAMAIEADGDHMVICSCDLTSIGSNLMDLVREKLSGVEGLNPMNVILNATHTHTSIKYTNSRRIKADSSLTVLQDFLPEGKSYKKLVEADNSVMQGDEGLYFIAERVTEAVKKAWENKKPAMYANEFGRAAVGMCRRVCYSDGSAKMWGDADTATFTHLEGGNDSGIELLFTFDENKKLTGIVANIACPSQVVEQRSFISSDYWGKVKILLREKFGEDLFVLCLGGAGGDQCPRDLVRWVDPETPIDDPNVFRAKPSHRKADPSMYDIGGTWKIGKRVAREIIDVFEEMPDEDIKSDAEFSHENITLDLPLRRVTPKEYEVAKKAIEEFVAKADSINFADNAAMHVHAGTISRYKQQETIDIYPTEVHIARFGDVAFATNAFELFLDYGNQIKARSKAAQTFIVQLACAADGYLPTEKAEKGSHYSAYVSSGVTGHEGGDILVRKTLEKINKLWD
ncbi:MAG: hypothetical protein J6L59_04850 [Clostridia bacterium]|nr:hypothetical protein [Clostridia bacterium]